MKHSFKTALIATSLAVFSATLSLAGGLAHAGGLDGIVKTGETSLGTVLTDTKGMTLYTFTKDANGKSACNGGCAVKWPPVFVNTSTAASADYTKITRDDGVQQWAYKGMPLYGWVKDKKPGDVTGDKVKGVWHVAKP